MQHYGEPPVKITYKMDLMQESQWLCQSSLFNSFFNTELVWYKWKLVSQYISIATLVFSGV